MWNLFVAIRTRVEVVLIVIHMGDLMLVEPLHNFLLQRHKPLDVEAAPAFLIVLVLAA